jgi:hypothetical protein
LLDFRLSLPEDWTRDEPRRQECHVPPEVRYQTRHEQCLEMLDAWGEQVSHDWVSGDDEFGRPTRFRHDLRERGERYVLGGALHPHDSRPGGAVARVLRAWTTAQGPLAIGDAVAPIMPRRCVDSLDGTRR